MKEQFCGSIADTFNSENPIVYVRFFAEVQGFDSTFEVVATKLRQSKEISPCDPKTEYDCEDTYCISKDLVCNGHRNCKYGWDDDNCGEEEGEQMLDLASPHVAVILVILLLQILGMFAALIWHLRRLIAQDREELAASKASLNREGIGALVAGERPLLPGDPGLQEDSQATGIPLPLPGVPVGRRGGNATPVAPDSNGACYVPDGGFPLQREGERGGRF